MKVLIHRRCLLRLTGFSLVEVVVSMGVLSVAVLSAVALLGKSAGMRSDVAIDSQAPMIVDKVVGELNLAMAGNAAYARTEGDLRMLAAALPLDVPSLQTVSGDPLVLLFSSEGVPLGVVDEREWEEGSANLDGAILVRCDGAVDSVTPTSIRVELTLSYPAVAPLKRRRSKSYMAVLAVRAD